MIGLPKGIGALYVRRGTPLEPLIHGADQESGRRAGTESALLAVALGTASKLARDLRPMKRVRDLRDHFWQALHARFTGCVVLNGHPESRLPNTLNVAFPNYVGADILARLDGVAASTGSACHSGRIELSPVLKAMGIRPEVGMGAIRFSLGRCTTIEEIDAAIDRLTDVLAAGSRLNATTSANAALPTIAGKLLFHVIVDDFHHAFSIDGPGGPNGVRLHYEMLQAARAEKRKLRDFDLRADSHEAALAEMHNHFPGYQFLGTWASSQST